MVSINAFKELKGIQNFFASKPQTLNNIAVKELKLCPLLSKDVCIKTLPQKKSVQIIDDLTESLNINSQNVETLCLNLYKNMQKSGREFVRTDAIKEIVRITGLSEKQAAKEMDNIASMISVLKPCSLNAQEPRKIFEIMLGTQKAKVSYLAQGLSGSVYKIEIPGAKPMALKKFHGTTHALNNIEGAYAETAIQKKLYEDGVCDTAALIAANPDRGWILSEFIDSNYKMRKNGTRIKEYLEKNGLKFDDINGGMNVKDADGNDILVDFGYIIPKKYQNGKETNSLIRKVNDEISKEKSHFDLEKLVQKYNQDPKSRFQIIQDIQENADNEFCKEFYERVKNTPQMRLYTDYSEFVLGKSITDKSLMPETKPIEEIQKVFNECGFEGDINVFTAAQSEYNIFATKFNDFTTKLFEAMFSFPAF